MHVQIKEEIQFHNNPKYVNKIIVFNIEVLFLYFYVDFESSRMSSIT